MSDDDDKKEITDSAAAGYLVLAIIVFIGASILLYMNNKDTEDDKFGLNRSANAGLGVILYAAFVAILVMIAKLYDNKFNRNHGEEVEDRNTAGTVAWVGLVVGILILCGIAWYAYKQ
jgi:fucose permease